MNEFLDSLKPERRHKWLCRFVLSWASCDGSIAKEYFMLIVAEHTKESLGDSIVEFIDQICKEIFGGSVYFSRNVTGDGEHGKGIVIMRVDSTESLQTIRRTLEPYTYEYVPRSKLANLKSY
uniref:Uncharacterized protein n=1 Tax=Entomoneis paludosa TaxID=265537 RepID=A0A7S2V742_9STRA|mmetsp:Transcript_10511/g.21628  ORF Transcript_10511/g.21628 Transcript_10511/m.21628 type:complete len:122 (+) Transcript_10511:217-582(+)